MPTVEKVELNVDKLHEIAYYDNASHQHNYNAALNLIDTSSLEFKLNTCGTITDETTLKQTIKYIDIWPKIIIVETNNHITNESLSTFSLTELIKFRFETLNNHANSDDSLSKDIIQSTKNRLEYIKSVLPTIIILQPNEWEITESGRIYFSLKGHEGLQDLVSVFDVTFEDWVSKTLSVISLDTEAVFYPHLDILDIVLDHNALLSTYKLFSTRLKRQVIFRLKGTHLVITSPLYSGKTNYNFSTTDKYKKRKHDLIDNDIILMIEKGLYQNHHSIEKIKDIISYHKQEENYGCIHIDKNFYYSVKNTDKKPIPLMLTQGFIPGYTLLDENCNYNDNNNNNDDGGDEIDDYGGGTSYSDNKSVTKKENQFKTVDFLVSCAVIENIHERNRNARDEGATGVTQEGTTGITHEGTRRDNNNGITIDDETIYANKTSSKNMDNLLKTNNDVIQKINKISTKNHTLVSSNWKVDTIAIFNNFIDANKIISQSAEHGHKNIKVDIQIDGKNLLSSVTTGLNAMNGSSVFRGGRLVGDFDGHVHFRPIFDECFPVQYYPYIPMNELVSYLLDPPQSIREREVAGHERYQPAVRLLYKVLFENDVKKYAKDSNASQTTSYSNNNNYHNNNNNNNINNSDIVKKILNKMTQFTLQLSQKLFGICDTSLFSDRLWNYSHWDFPIGVVVCLYGMLLQRLGTSHELWKITHEAVLVQLLVPVFDCIIENGIWVASQVRSFMGWTIEDVLMPLLKTKNTIVLSNEAIDSITYLAFQWIAIDSAAKNKGLCKCFPNSLTWFYIEPNRKMIDYVYSPIPKFILSDHMLLSDAPVTSKTVHTLIQNWIPTKRIGDRLFAIRNLVMPIRRSFSYSYSFTLNSLNGLRIVIKGSSPHNDNDNGGEEKENSNGNNEDDITIKYHYIPPVALSEPNAGLLSLGTLKDLKMLDASLSVVWTDKASSQYSASEIIKKEMKQKKFNVDNTSNTDTIQDKYIVIENSSYNINYWMSQLSCETLKLITDKKKSTHSFIDGIAEDLPLDVIEEMASPIIKNCITFNSNDNDGFSWLFDYGLNFHLVKLEPLSDHVHLSNSTGIDKLDKLLSNFTTTREKMNINTSITTTTTNNNKDDFNINDNHQNNKPNYGDHKMRTLVPFQFLEHVKHYHYQKQWKTHETTENSSAFNIDSTLIFIYKKLPKVLECIMLRIMITSEQEEIELVRKLAINVSRIIADSLLICLDPRNAHNIKMTLEEPVMITRDEMGVFSLRKKGKRDTQDENDNNLMLTEILSSSKYLSLISEKNSVYKDTLRDYFNSLNWSRSLSSIFTKEEREIIDNENSPVQKNIKNRRGLENISQTWTDDNINRPYVVPTFQGKDGNRFASLMNMPDNLHIYVPTLPTSFLMAEQIKSILDIAKDKTKHLIANKKEQSDLIEKHKNEINEQFMTIWGNSGRLNKLEEAFRQDFLSVLKGKQNIAIKNKKLFFNLPFLLDLVQYQLHLAIRSVTDIDYYIKVPNFWRMMDIDEMLKFAISLMLITLEKLVNVGLNTAKRFSEIAEAAKCLHKAEDNVMF
uniref:Wsv289-like protein n=1 Tax=Melicertus latisulcatus majanivirus TaxID=2984277 RepID=A0A9C7BMM3_9VIRU|nr:MAG: wsv289-like protein [Melicertus latisulcatus majanivirus]